MSKIGRNDPCPSGAEVKYKKCLRRHPELRADSEPADIWLVCDQWTAPMPDAAQLCRALMRPDTAAPEAKVSAFLNELFQHPTASVDWPMVLQAVQSVRYSDWVGLFHRVRNHLPDVAPAQLAGCYAALARPLMGASSETVPELVKAALELPEPFADPDALNALHACLEMAGQEAECHRLEARFDWLPRAASPDPDDEMPEMPATGDEASEEGDLQTPEPAEEPPPAFDWKALKGCDVSDYAELSPEVEGRLFEIWKAFMAPEADPADPARLDTLLDQLLAQPPEGTDWSRLFHRFARAHHPDLPGVFRRIAAAVPHTHDTAMSFFYWAAAEEFDRLNLVDQLPAVAVGCARLDGSSYDADGLAHIEDYLLAHGCDEAALKLAEHFLPIERADEGLVPWAVSSRVSKIFNLRMGQWIKAVPVPDAVETVTQDLKRDFDPEEELYPEFAQAAAEAICQPIAASPWPRERLDLQLPESENSRRGIQAALRLMTGQIEVARHAWRTAQVRPGCMLAGLDLVASGAYWWRGEGKKRHQVTNLLDALRPTGMEARCAWTCNDLMGVNPPKAKLMLAATAALLQFAKAHQLISAVDVQQSQRELEWLEAKLRVPD